MHQVKEQYCYWITKSVEQYHAEAIIKFFSDVKYGSSPCKKSETDFPQNTNEYYLYKAADAGYAPAQFEIFNILETKANSKGDELMAFRWLNLAAEKEHPEALSLLAWAYLNGNYNQKIDISLGISLLEKSIASDKDPVSKALTAKTLGISGLIIVAIIFYLLPITKKGWKPIRFA